MKNFLVKLIPYIFLAGVAFLSYHQLLQMYFWRDDYTGLYFSQKDITGDPAFAYPYQIAFLVERFFWQIFGLDAARYFLVEIFLYASATCLLFYFLQKLFRDKKVAFFSGLVFAAGYIGQDAMKMSMGDGLGTMVALNILLLNLVVFIQYLLTRKKILFIFSLIFFFLTLEVAPQRTSSFILVLLLLDWMVSFKDRKAGILKRNFSFITVFLVQYFIHPTVWLLGYRLLPPDHFLGLLLNFSPIYLLNPLGTFWNMLFPSSLQEEINIFMEVQKSLTQFKLWMFGIPTLIFSAVSLACLKFIRPKYYTFKNILIIFSSLFFFSVLWSYITIQINIDRYDLISIFNGGLIMLFLLVLISVGVPKSRKVSLLGLLIIFSMLGIFFITIPERVLVSYNRYLLIPAFSISFLPFIFITNEFYQKRRAANILFFIFIFVLVVPRLISALYTQRQFVQVYSLHAKTFYQQLRGFLLDIDKKKIIYVEGATKELDLSIGDAQRVGYLGSEAAVAINLGTKKENVILPQFLEEIPRLLREGTTLKLGDVHTFIYGEQGLYETSRITRELLVDNQFFTVSPTEWEGLNFYPSERIWTLQPLEIVVPLKVPTGILGTEVFWEYNTYGAVHKNRSVEIPLFADELWHEYKFIIPAGGEYLKRIYFKEFTSIPEIGITRITYQED